MTSRPNNDERDRTGAGGGERTTDASCISVVVEGNEESSKLGDGVSLGNGNTDLRGLDIAAASANTIPGYAIGPASTEPLEEVGTVAGPPTAFIATNGVAEVGGEERASAQWKVEW